MTDAAEPQQLAPTPMSKADLLGLLYHVTDLVERGDSFEGLVNWLLPDPDDPRQGEFLVEARYRTGNSQGQGGFELVGDWVDKAGAVIQHIDPSKGLNGPSAN